MQPKMQKKKVLLITYGNRDHASTRVRALNHFDRLKDVFDVTWAPRVLEDNREGLFQKIYFAITKRLLAAGLYCTVLFFGFDIAFVQVRFLPAWCLRILKRKKTLICFDFDDAVYTYSIAEFDMMMKYADKVIVATPHLEEYVKAYNKTCRVIFSPVDTDLIVPLKNMQPVFTIGWIGSNWTLPYLKTLTPVFQALKGKISFKLLVAGADISLPGIETECLPWSEQNELEALRRIDIGIMPLIDDEWSRMKGGYKLYLYMAAGKPAVASPYGINADIIKPGITGFLASNETEWLAAFEKLQNDVVLRRSMGDLARQNAEQKYSYRVCTKQMIEFINN